MKKNVAVSLSGVVVLLGAAQVQAAPVTNITVNNIRSTSVTRTGTINVSGYLSPLPQTTIPAGGSDFFGSYTSGTVDAGVLYYGGAASTGARSRTAESGPSPSAPRRPRRAWRRRRSRTRSRATTASRSRPTDRDRHGSPMTRRAER
ncbi:hypothetical protein ACN28S_24740 [Cystobacter fuscus]